MWDDTTDRQLRAWLDAVDAQWRRTGLSALSRHQLRRALEVDLAEALAAGASVADLTATDPEEFADQLAAAHGRPGTPPSEAVPITPGRLATTTLGGAVAGALVVWFVVWPLLFSRTDALSDNASVAIAYPVAAVVVLLGSMIALRHQFGGAGMTRFLPPVAGLVVGALLGLPATLTISAALDYPTDPALVIIEAIPVLALGLGGAFLGPRLVTAAAARRGGAPVLR